MSKWGPNKLSEIAIPAGCIECEQKRSCPVATSIFTVMLRARVEEKIVDLGSGRPTYVGSRDKPQKFSTTPDHGMKNIISRHEHEALFGRSGPRVAAGVANAAGRCAMIDNPELKAQVCKEVATEEGTGTFTWGARHLWGHDALTTVLPDAEEIEGIYTASVKLVDYTTGPREEVEALRRK
ncbi:MAG: hypothetical protein AAF413_03285 [Patescibacteria group bacterium]